MRPRPSLVVVVLVASLLVYSGVAITRHWWPSAVVAPLVAALLWRRHRRARFSAYVFFSVLAARGALTHVWVLPLYALAAVGLMQTSAARVAWPRLTPGRARDDRMRR
jgi:chromate transport protein ChrA